MNIDGITEYLKKRFAKLDSSVFHDEDNRGNLFNELIYPNEHQPNMPITVTVSDEGCLISVGQIANVTGDYPITHEQAAEAIDDIVNDRIIFALGYDYGDDIGFGAPFMTEIFAITGGVDDMSAELEKFIAKISTPLSKFKRRFTKLKGRFIITNFSGSENRTIIR